MHVCVTVSNFRCFFFLVTVLIFLCQVHDLEVKVRTREAEFEKYRQELITRPESKLQAELSVAQLEKVERRELWLCRPSP